MKPSEWIKERAHNRAFALPADAILVLGAILEYLDEHMPEVDAPTVVQELLNAACYYADNERQHKDLGRHSFTWVRRLFAAVDAYRAALHHD